MVQAIATFDYGAGHSSVQVRPYVAGEVIREQPLWRYEVDTRTAVNELGVNCELVDDAFNHLTTALGRYLGGNSDVKLAGMGTTAHAISPVYLDTNGHHAFHGFVKYLCSEDGSLGPLEDFNERYSGANYLETATPSMPDFLNWAKGADALQRTFPKKFEGIESLLFLNSYIGFLLTGEKGFDLTQLAAHGYGARFTSGSGEERIGVSSVIEQLGLASKLPQCLEPFEVLGITTKRVQEQYGIPKGIPVIEGFHDSLATHYLTTSQESFTHGITSSTGTWAVNMADRRFSLESALEDAGVFYNAGTNGPVRSSIFRGGDMRKQVLALVPGSDRAVPFDERVLSKLFESGDVIEPAFMSGVGPYGGKKFIGPDAVSGMGVNYLHHTVGMSYAIQLARSVELASRLEVPTQQSMEPFYEDSRTEPIVVYGVAQKPIGGEENITMQCLAHVTPRPVFAVDFEGSPASFGTHVAVVRAIENSTAAEVGQRVRLNERCVSRGGPIEDSARDYVRAWEERVSE